MNDLKGIILQLEHQRSAIDRALSALKEATGLPETKPSTRSNNGRAQRKSRITPEGRRRLSEALKRRWAAKRALEAASKRASSKRAATKKRA